MISKSANILLHIAKEGTNYSVIFLPVYRWKPEVYRSNSRKFS